MPQRLLNHLDKFCNISDIKSKKKSNKVFLIDILDISDAGCDELDNIADAIKDIWSGKEPPVDIQRIMAIRGFPIVPTLIEFGIWRKAHIVTPHGMISI